MAQRKAPPHVWAFYLRFGLQSVESRLTRWPSRNALCRFVRAEILKDNPAPRKVVPIPKNMVHQQGNLIMEKVDELPPAALPIRVQLRPD